MYKALNIHPVSHGTRKAKKNRFCGPAVISALTGLTTMDGSRLIRVFSGKGSVTGTSEQEMKSALGACGIRMSQSEFEFETNITLARFLKISSEWRQSRVFLISAGRHWQLVQGRRFVCGQTEAVVGFKHPKVHRRSRVRGVWMLTASEGLKMPKELLEARKAQKKREIERKSALQKKRQLLVLCNQHNLEVDCDDDLWDRGGESRYWFSFSEHKHEKIIDEREERGENDVERYAYGLDEALEKAFEMIELKKTL